MNLRNLITRAFLFVLLAASGFPRAAAADFSGSPYGRRLPISGTNIVLEGVFPAARSNYLFDAVMMNPQMAGFEDRWVLGEQWWSWTPPVSGEVVFIAEPDGTPISDQGYAVGYGDYSGDPFGIYSVPSRRIRTPWPDSEPRPVFGPDFGRESMKHRAPYTIAHFSVTQGVASVVAAMGMPGRPYRFRLLCSAGPLVAKQPPAKRFVRQGDSLFLSALVAGPVTNAIGFYTWTDLQQSRPLWTSQWFKDSSPIDGATNGCLVKDNVSTADAGRYHLVVTSATGATESTPCDVEFISGDAPLPDLKVTTLGVVGGWLRLRARTSGDSVSITTTTNLAWKPIPDDPFGWNFPTRMAFRLQPGIDAEFQVLVGAARAGFFHVTDYRPLEPFCAATLTAGTWARDQLVLNHGGSSIATVNIPLVGSLTGFQINTERKCAALGTISATSADSPVRCDRPGHVWVTE